MNDKIDVDSMSLEELYASLGIKPIPRSARKHPDESAVQLLRRLRAKAEKGAFVF
ncbi:hypothetical protein L6303_05890 [archaeon]|nr:hypothetical protein [Nanoarchaeota archaeon]MBU4451237.1 hypothetical protein [Nanoarchaeota archaeon]MCG2724250.1 hypothetical protein [archaeon]